MSSTDVIKLELTRLEVAHVLDLIALADAVGDHRPIPLVYRSGARPKLVDLRDKLLASWRDSP